MFGTPNHSAVRASSLTVPLMWMLHAAVTIQGHWLRAKGVLQLTDVHKVFQTTLEDHAARADGVEYLTIPGTYFHDNRHALDLEGLSPMGGIRDRYPFAPTYLRADQSARRDRGGRFGEVASGRRGVALRKGRLSSFPKRGLLRVRARVHAGMRPARPLRRTHGSQDC